MARTEVERPYEVYFPINEVCVVPENDNREVVAGPATGPWWPE